MSSPEFRVDFEPRYGEAVELVSGVERIVCNNPSPFTFHGTNSYILGEESVAVIDPGPADDDHLAALLAAIKGRPVSHIIVTHTHMDHSPLAGKLQDETGAPILAEGPHRPARPLNLGETNPLEASGDNTFEPDIAIEDGDLIEGEGWTLRSIFTPGHTANHTSFALLDSDYLFSGDHVMGWATSIVAPPDGAMSEYMESLDRIMQEPQQTYYPGHGGRLEDAHKFVRALRAHRRIREQAVLDQIRKGRESIPEMVAVIYRNTDPKLHKAAGLSVLAHLEDLVGRGVVTTDGPPAIDGTYRPG